jgi:regulatory protein
MNIKSAIDKTMDYVARRDHSEKELRQKLSLRFSSEEIDKAIEFAKQKKWLASTDDELLVFSLKVAEALHRKKKGINYINNYLKKKGLPPIKKDSERELEKARSLLGLKKLQLQKAQRFLSSRGFDFETIHKSLKVKHDLDFS